MKTFRRIQLVFLLLVLPANSGILTANEAAPEKIVIFHFNDLHAKIDALAKVAWLVGRERVQNHNVFLLAAGDSFTGNPVVDQFQPPGLPVLRLLNRIGLDMTTLGNHEFDYGLAILKSHMQQGKYHFIGANLLTGKSGLPQPPPYRILKTAVGSEIAVLGLVQVSAASGLPDTHPDKVRGLRFEEPGAAARRFAILKNRYPVLIALTHIGFDQDVQLAQVMPQLDVIIGGHSHTVIREPQEFSGVLIVQAGANGAFLGRVDLLLESGRLASKKGILIDLKSQSQEDPGVRKMIDAYNDNPRLNRLIIDSGVVLVGKDELGSLMADAARREMKLDMAFINNGGIRSDELPSCVRLKTIYQIDPFGNQIVRFSLSAAEIRSLICSAFERQKQIDLQAAGLQYDVITTPDGAVRQIVLFNEDGSPLAEKREYAVGLNSFLASAYAFDHRDAGAALHVTSADCLIHYLEKKPVLSRYKGMINARLQVEKQP